MSNRVMYYTIALCLIVLALSPLAFSEELSRESSYVATVTFSIESVQCVVIESEAMPQIVYEWDSERRGYEIPSYAGGGFWVRNLSSPDFAPCFTAALDPEDVEAFKAATGLNARLVDPAPGVPLQSGESRLLSIEYEGFGAIYQNSEAGNQPYAERLDVIFTFWTP